MSRIAPSPIVALFVLAAAACNESGTNPSGPRITVTPSTLNLNVGASEQLDAVLTAGAGTIVWSSGSPAVASVDQQGEVTGVSAGTATIRAEWQSNPAVFGTAVVTVNQTGVPITITSITRNGQSLNLSSLAGSFTVAMEADVPADFDGVAQVLMGGVVVGETDIVDGVPSGVVANGIRTSRIRLGLHVQSSTYPVQVVGSDMTYKVGQGQQDISTVLKTLPGVVVASGSGPSATVNNRIGAITGLTAGGPDILVDGRHYYGGDLNVELRVVVPTGGSLTGITDIGAQIERIEVLEGPAGAAYGRNAISGVVNLILSKDEETANGGIKKIGEGRFGVTRVDLIGTTTDTATILNQYPLNDGLGAAYIYLDQSAPVIPVDSVTLEQGASGVWIGFNTSIGRRLAQNGLRSRDTATATVIEEGSGIERCGLHIGPLGNLSATPIDSGYQYGSQTTSPNLDAEYRCRDRMGHISIAPLITGPGGPPQKVGFDYLAPLLQVTDTVAGIPGLIHRSINPVPGTPIHITVGDVLFNGASSGLDDESLEMLGILAYFGIVSLDACVDGLWKAEKNECKPIRLNPMLQIAPVRFPDGEYTYDLEARDVAGNLSLLRQYQILEDHVDPVVDNFVAPTALTAGASWNTAFRIQDGIEVGGWSIAYQYAGVTKTLVYGTAKVGTPFDNQWATSVTAQLSHRYPASAELLTLSGAYYKPEGVERRAQNFVYGGYDNANRTTYNAFPIGGISTYGSWQSFGAGLNGGDRYEFTGSSYQVCYNPFGANGNCNGIPEQITVNLDVYFPTGRINTIEELRLTRMWSNGPFDYASVVPGAAATVTRQNFGGFYIDHYSKTLSGLDYFPGNYRIGMAAFAGPSHSVLLGIDLGLTKPMNVFQAKYTPQF